MEKIEIGTHRLRCNDKCRECGSILYSITNYEVKDKHIILTKECIKCSHKEIIKRKFEERA